MAISSNKAAKYSYSASWQHWTFNPIPALCTEFWELSGVTHWKGKTDYLFIRILLHDSIRFSCQLSKSTDRECFNLLESRGEREREQGEEYLLCPIDNACTLQYPSFDASSLIRWMQEKLYQKQGVAWEYTHIHTIGLRCSGRIPP